MAATGIDIFLTGLMLLCLDGQPNCPAGENLAWVVRADGTSMPCGRISPEKTRLEVTYLPKEEFDIDEAQIICERESVGDRFRCVLPEGEICVIPSSGVLASNQLLGEVLHGLPRLDEIDRRFKTVQVDRLSNPFYVSGRIHYPRGVVDVGAKWPGPTRWFRSDGGAGGGLPRELSDRLKVTYQMANQMEKFLTVTDCGARKLIVFKRNPEAEKAEIILRNAAVVPPEAEHIDQYDDLAYLIWYYRLGSWDTPFGSCPDYTAARKDAILLRCVRDSALGCAQRPLQSDTRFWPPTFRP